MRPLFFFHGPHQILDVGENLLRLGLARSSSLASRASLSRFRACLPRNAAWIRCTAYNCAMSSSSPSTPTIPCAMFISGTPSTPARADILDIFRSSHQSLAHLANLQGVSNVYGQLIDVDAHRARRDRLEHVLVVQVVGFNLQVKVLLEPEESEREISCPSRRAAAPASLMSDTSLESPG